MCLSCFFDPSSLLCDVAVRAIYLPSGSGCLSLFCGNLVGSSKNEQAKELPSFDVCICVGNWLAALAILYVRAISSFPAWF